MKGSIGISLQWNRHLCGFPCQYKVVIINLFSVPPEPEKNFALESYGPGAKCFDHTESMWEERGCKQTREWQHWGSGCYNYKCANGRIHILVANYTYECYYPGQEISIRIFSGGWLHRGALKCPPCKDVCAEEFRSRGEHCRVSEEAPPLNMYPRDALVCGAISSFRSADSLVLLLVGCLLTILMGQVWHGTGGRRM